MNYSILIAVAVANQKHSFHVHRESIGMNLHIVLHWIWLDCPFCPYIESSKRNDRTNAYLFISVKSATHDLSLSLILHFTIGIVIVCLLVGLFSLFTVVHAQILKLIELRWRGGGESGELERFLTNKFAWEFVLNLLQLQAIFCVIILHLILFSK